MIFEGIQFAHPIFLGLLLLVPLLGVYYFRKYQEQYANVTISNTAGFAEVKSIRIMLRPIMPILRLIAITGLIFALARPQSVLKQENVTAEGIDIVMAMDVSSSMLSKDFEPDRLEASKKVAAKFVDRRTHDRIGLVVFSGESFTQCPLTTDHGILKEFFNQIECGLIADGTAIGMGLANAVKRLKDSEVKSKIVILLTDGVNNSGYTSPMQAADAAKKLGVKVYTVGVGTEGHARAPIARRQNGSYVFGMTKVEIDEALLKRISEETGGQYYRAVDMESLEAVYAEIDRLETTKIETTTIRRYREEFYFLVWIALGCVVLEVLLANTLFRSMV
ncbi:MAG: VWA domain-containing protein [Aureispira sp.]|nr:VWA domain-containing protein [Aureispira sp.]